MRPWIWMLLLVAGCDAVGVVGRPNAPGASPTGGGGGGGGYVAPNVRVADPLPGGDCPIDYAARLERDIEAVPDERAHDSLYVQWRLLEKVVDAGGETEIQSAAQSLRLMLDRLEAHGDVAPDAAGAMRALLHCYLP